MNRNPSLTALLPDPIREAVGLPVGWGGGLYVGDTRDFGQTETSDIIDYNQPPKGQPGLWCQWVLTENGEFLEWDGGEKFYYYTEWLQYLVANFFEPWGIKLNGSIEWNGEERSDVGRIVAVENEIREQAAKFVYE